MPITQKVIDEMRMNAQAEAEKKFEDWRKVFMDVRHPDSMPDQMARLPMQSQPPGGMVNDGNVR